MQMAKARLQRFLDLSKTMKLRSGFFWMVYVNLVFVLRSKPLLISPQTPATCANVAIHNVYHGKIDLLVRVYAFVHYFQNAHSITRFPDQI